ncbi:MAG: cytochrome b/b6 domain-containing protein [Alsobacter sp.]
MIRRYSNVQIVLHWVVVVLVVAQYATSGAITRSHQPRLIGQKPDPTDLVLHTAHNRVGLLILLLMAGRLIIRFAREKSAPGPTGLNGLISQLVHWSFYAVLIAEGAAGAVASYLWWPASTAHVTLFKVLIGLSSVHVVAVIWHQFVMRDGTLRAMLPRLTVSR